MKPLQKIIKIFEENPSEKEEFESRFKTTVKEYIEENNLYFLNEFEKINPLELERIADNGCISNIFAHLPPKIVAKEFGEEILFWAYVQYPFFDEREKMCYALQKYCGKNEFLLEKARLSVWRFGSSSDFMSVRKASDFFHKMDCGFLEKINLEEILKNNPAEKITLDKKRLADYSIMQVFPTKHNTQGLEQKYGKYDSCDKEKLAGLYLDGPCGIALNYKGIPNALISFAPLDENRLKIMQIQGLVLKVIKDGQEVAVHHSRGLFPLDWKKALVEITESVAADFKYGTIMMQSAYNNKWCMPNEEGQAHLPLSRAYQIYDETAKRLGYKRNKKRDWYKALSIKKQNFV